jgi:hypothetical protein
MKALEARGAEVFYYFGHADCITKSCAVRVAAFSIHYPLAFPVVEAVILIS